MQLAAARTEFGTAIQRHFGAAATVHDSAGLFAAPFPAEVRGAFFVARDQGEFMETLNTIKDRFAGEAFVYGVLCSTIHEIEEVADVEAVRTQALHAEGFVDAFKGVRDALGCVAQLVPGINMNLRDRRFPNDRIGGFLMRFLA